MFISEFEKKESLRNVISKIYKSHDAKKKQVSKDSLNYLRDSIFLILEENNSIFACWLHSPKACLEPNQTSMMEFFVRIVNC